MTKQEIIETLKNSYPRDTRKQLVKTLQAEEKSKEIPKYKIINQIFSYVLSELGWEMAQNTSDWDKTPLEIMEEVFPSIEKTNWYQEQQLTAQNTIDVEMR